MQTIQIDGTHTYAANIKNLKIGDQIKLIPNPNNRLNSNAIGAYTTNNTKIGYVPYTSNQIDINSKYTISKINLSKSNPILLISRCFEQSNFIQIEPNFIKELKYCKNNKDDYKNENLEHFKIFLLKSGNIIDKIKITYQDENFVNLFIQTPHQKVTFMTVTKKYYDDNIFKYDEFFNFKLIPKCIYQPFMIHRLEVYLEKNYKSIDKILKMKKFSFDSLKKLNIFDKINENDFGFEKIELPILKTIPINKLFKILNYKQLNYFIQLLVQYNIESNKYYDPSNYIKFIEPTLNYELIPNLEYFTNYFDKIKLGGLCYNHILKYYCDINLFDDLNIIDIFLERNITKEKFIEMIIKLIISNKQIVNLYNPLDGILFRFEISNSIKENILNIIISK